jgi:hypothetical protein
MLSSLKAQTQWSRVDAMTLAKQWGIGLQAAEETIQAMTQLDIQTTLPLLYHGTQDK